MTGRKLAIMIVAVLGAILLGVMVFLFVQRRSAVLSPGNTVTPPSTQTTGEGNGTEAPSDPCAAKTGDEHDGCYISAAASGKNLALCEEISDSGKQQECHRFVTVLLATSRLDAALCATLANADDQRACEQRVFIAVTGVAGCDAFSDVHKERCRTTQILLTARTAADCRQISDEALVQRCTEGLRGASGSGAIDRDGDGLSDYAEATLFHSNPTKKDTDGDGFSDYNEVYIYKTSPLKKDTDGDGFTDNGEVQQGFNPLGPGPALYRYPTPTR